MGVRLSGVRQDVLAREQLKAAHDEALQEARHE